MDVVGLWVCAYEGRENRFRAVGFGLKAYFFPHKISSNLGGGRNLRVTPISHCALHSPNHTPTSLKPLYVCSTLKELSNDMRLVAVRGRMGI